MWHKRSLHWAWGRKPFYRWQKEPQGGDRKGEKVKCSHFLFSSQLWASDGKLWSNYPDTLSGNPKFSSSFCASPEVAQEACPLSERPVFTGHQVTMESEQEKGNEWSWEMPQQSTPNSTKFWKSKVLFITYWMAKYDTNMKLCTIFIYPTYYNVFDYTVLVIDDILSTHLLPLCIYIIKVYLPGPTGFR